MNNAHVKLPQSHTENANCTNGNGGIPAKLAGAHGLVVLEFDRDHYGPICSEKTRLSESLGHQGSTLR